jgi:malate dehydrogenase (oxaloacetate-decarboxylating)
MSSPTLNRGVGFTHEQRRGLGLTGRLPSAVLTLEQQADRVWHQLQSMATDLGRNLHLEQLHYRHELLYFKVLADHLTELMPVVYTPTVGEAIQRFSDEYRGQRGLFLSIDEPDEIAEAFETFGLGPDDVDLIVCTDAEAILGIGDWGVGGIQIAVGKLALYTAGGGIDPRRCIAVSLDVGTDNEQLLQDPFYLGNRHARRRGDEYDEFIKTYIQTAHRLFPHAILHFEDFGPINARKILQTYGDDYCVFNDDVQGTGAVVVAAVHGGSHVTGVPLRDQKTIVFGAGTAGIGVADQIRDAMVDDGATVEQATSQIWAIDRHGLLFDDMDDLRDFQVPYAKNRRQLRVADGEQVGLVDAIKLASPTLLLGSSTVFGAFTQEVVEAMTASCERPMIFPLSNPTSRMEAMPADVLEWSNGRALVTTGTPVAPVEYKGVTYTIGQANNVLVFPGLGLGMIVAGARLLTPGMMHASAKAIARQASPTNSGDSLLPDMQNLCAVSAAVAEAVYDAAVADGVATKTHDDVGQAVRDTMWRPAYD